MFIYLLAYLINGDHSHTCLENLDIPGNLMAVGELTTSWGKRQEWVGIKSCLEKCLLFTFHLGQY